MFSGGDGFVVYLQQASCPSGANPVWEAGLTALKSTPDFIPTYYFQNIGKIGKTENPDVKKSIG